MSAVDDGTGTPWRQESSFGRNLVHRWQDISSFRGAEVRADGFHVIEQAHGGPLEFLTKGLPFEQADGPVMVVFSGAVTNREERVPPFASGRSLAPGLGVPLIALSDPTLSLAADLGISWYAGSVTQDVQGAVEALLRPLAETLDGDLWLVGGSAGGFAALEMGHRLGRHCSVFVWNAQTNIAEYAERYVKHYARTAFPGYDSAAPDASWKSSFMAAMRRQGRRFDVSTETIPAQAPRRLLYLQGVDDWHAQSHCAPYLEQHDYRRHSAGLWIRDVNRVIWFAETGRGHTPPAGPTVHTILDRLFTADGDSVLQRTLEMDAAPLFEPRRPAVRPDDLTQSRAQVAALVSWRLRDDVVHGSMRQLPEDYGRMRWSAQLLGDKDRVLQRTQNQTLPSQWAFRPDPDARRIRVSLSDGLGHTLVRRHLQVIQRKVEQ